MQELLHPGLSLLAGAQFQIVYRRSKVHYLMGNLKVVCKPNVAHSKCIFKAIIPEKNGPRHLHKDKPFSSSQPQPEMNSHNVRIKNTI